MSKKIFGSRERIDFNALLIQLSKITCNYKIYGWLGKYFTISKKFYLNFSLTFILFHFETPQPFLLPLLAFLSPFVSHNYNNLFFSTNLSLFTFAVFVCVSFQKVTDVFFTRKKFTTCCFSSTFHTAKCTCSFPLSRRSTTWRASVLADHYQERP